MGRYYNGDIEGKFMFGVQSSNDADFFGDIGEPNVLCYHFDKEDSLESIKKGINECKKNLGDWREKIDKFFKDNEGYNDEMLKSQIGLDRKKNKEVLEWYARIELGEQILKCVEKNGSCTFEAEI